VALNEKELRAQLAIVREELDKVDSRLIRLLARRLELGLEAAGIKHALGMPVQDLGREADVIAQARIWARETGLSEDEVQDVIERLIALSRSAQERAAERL
jgi:chorismate mutase